VIVDGLDTTVSWGAIYISLVNGENVDVADGGARENDVKQLTHCNLRCCCQKESKRCPLKTPGVEVDAWTFPRVMVIGSGRILRVERRTVGILLIRLRINSALSDLEWWTRKPLSSD
jgi:hypothetical protein